jgi:hypothetical protein
MAGIRRYQSGYDGIIDIVAKLLMSIVALPTANSRSPRKE